ncbi:MAG TPA: hypothetical protein PKA42_03205 [Candidatus Paceibacterota bacterium]|nr:hypothetical protein [Candidatus Paceibacterota bacterium]HMO83149.1 hypothetical protein [Candidatus Paceibacterota bacterium]
MRRIKLFTGTVAVFLLPFLVSAQGLAKGDATGGRFGELLANIIQFSSTVLIPFIIGIGFLVFVWGMFQYFILGGANDDSKEKGKSLMIYATAGFLLILIFWGIINLLASFTGLQNESLDKNLPTLPSLPGRN